MERKHHMHRKLLGVKVQDIQYTTVYVLDVHGLGTILERA